MIRIVAASALVLFAAASSALAQSALPPFLFDKFGLGRVQSEVGGTPRVDADVVYSRWIRRCYPACLTTKTGMLSGRLVVGAFLVEAEGDGWKVLHVRLPRDFRQAAGARMFIDDDTPRIDAYRYCRAEGCIVDFTVDASFVAKLRAGRYLQIQGVDAAGQWTSYRLALDDFATAAYGTPIDPATYREPKLQGDDRLRTPPR